MLYLRHSSRCSGYLGWTSRKQWWSFRSTKLDLIFWQMCYKLCQIVASNLWSSTVCDEEKPGMVYSHIHIRKILVLILLRRCFLPPSASSVLLFSVTSTFTVWTIQNGYLLIEWLRSSLPKGFSIYRYSIFQLLSLTTSPFFYFPFVGPYSQKLAANFP